MNSTKEHFSMENITDLENSGSKKVIIMKACSKMAKDIGSDL